MAGEAQIKVTFPDTALFDESKRKEILKETIIGVDDVLINTQHEIVKRTPIGVTSLLANSINTQRTIAAQAVIGEINSGNVPYAPAVNDGRKKAYAPIRPLMQWIRLSSAGQAYFAAVKSANPKVTIKGAAYMLSISMKRKARKGQKFFQKGVEAAEPENNAIIDRMTDRIGALL